MYGRRRNSDDQACQLWNCHNERKQHDFLKHDELEFRYNFPAVEKARQVEETFKSIQLMSDLTHTAFVSGEVELSCSVR